MTVFNYINKPKGNMRLAADLLSSATVISVVSGDEANAPSAFPFLMTLEDEIIQFDSAVGSVVLGSGVTVYNFNVTRARETSLGGPAASFHSEGKHLQALITAGTLKELQDQITTLSSGLTLQQNPNLLQNGRFINNSTNGYGTTPDDWTDNSANATQGGFAEFTKAAVINAGIATDGQIEFLANLNEGNFSDLSSNNYGLTGAAGAAEPTDVISGLMHRCFDFEKSSSQYATGSAANAKITGAQSWMAFVKPESIATSSNIICGFSDSDDSDNKFIYITTAGTVTFKLDGLSAPITSDVILETGKWYMIIAQYNGTDTLSITVNGVTKTLAVTGSISAGASTNLSIGRGGDLNNYYFDGLVQNVMILSKSLSETDRKKLWSMTTYSGLKISASGSDGYISQTLSGDDVIKLAGKTVTLSAYVIQPSMNTFTISINDGVSETESATYISADRTLVSVTKTISASATTLEVKLNILDGFYAFIDYAVLNLGSVAIDYSDSPKDHDRFPRLLRMDPPKVSSGYEFEEGRWFGIDGYTGFSGTPTQDSYFCVIGTVHTNVLNITGTSDVTTFTMRVSCAPKAARNIGPCRVENNSGWLSTGLIGLTVGTNMVGVFTDAGGGAFTASGTKALQQTIIINEYE